MATPTHTLLQNVNFTSRRPTFAGRVKWIMEECHLMEEPRINTAASIAAMIFGGAGAAAAISMWLSAGQINAHDNQALKAQMEYYQQQTNARLDTLTQQVGKVADAVNLVPRADQVQDIIRHLSSADGRMDAFDSRMRTLELQGAANTTRLDGIDAASRAPLGRPR